MDKGNRMRSSAIRRIAATALLAGVLLVSGCSPQGAGQSGAPVSSSAQAPATVKIGTLATQDTLPLWVAEQKTYFAEAGAKDVEIITFQSAQELQAAFSAGTVNAMMTDIIVAANLQAAGIKVVLPTVMLGATTDQGRFAIVSAPGQKLASMADLKGVPVGAASHTITEYVLDKLMEEAGVAAADVKTEEIPKMPIRFQLLMSGKIKAASLPEPFVSLAVRQGAQIVPGGDDTKAKSNISQSVLCVNREFADSAGGSAAVSALLKAWDKAVADINADPGSFRATLVSKARLPEPLSASYAVSTYPSAQAPTADEIQPVLDWMKAKGYLTAGVTPADLLP